MERRHFLTVAGTGGVLATTQDRCIAQTKLPLKDVVVLIPGIMGSVLSKGGKDIWALSGSAILEGMRTLGKNVSSLTLTGDSPDAEDLGDGVRPTRLIKDLHLIPGFWKIDGYSKISEFITTKFDARPNENFFEFPYDWRRDNRAAARRLARQSRQWLKRWRMKSGAADARLILVAHSMGGLVSRYFLENLEGWKDTRMLISFGTPYRGSLNAVDFLVNGLKKNIGPWTLVDLSGLARSFTSMYQLLPIYRSFDPGNGQLVRVGETPDIPNLDAKRAADALAFHNSIQDAVKKNAEAADYSARRYSLHPIIGNYQPTAQSAKRADRRVEILQSLGSDATLQGDGTVPEASARPIETPALEAAHRTVYVSEVHGSLQNSDPVLTHLAGLLREGGLNSSAFRDAALNVAVMIDDTYSTAEQVIVRARCEDPSQPLTAVVTNTATGQEVTRRMPTSSEAEFRLGLLPKGSYRVRVSGGANVGSASDSFVVVDI